MILTDDEIRKAAEFAAEQMWPESGYVGWTDDDAVFHRKFIEACFEKLRGGVELPAPTARFNWNLGKFERLVTFKHSEHHLKPLYTHDQLLAYGAAQRLAGRERGLKDAQAIESALLEKLRGGVELPEALGDGFTALVIVGDTPSLMEQKRICVSPIAVCSLESAIKYGAAQRLAGREQVLKEATDLDWTAIMCEGCLVTWENAETLGCHAVEHIRALAASPQEQT